MAGITLEKAITYFKRELGCEGDSEDERALLLDIITEGIEWMLFNGGGDILKEWTVLVRNGRFAFPRDLETPIKWKLGQTANTGYGSFHSPFHSYGSQGIRTAGGFFPWAPIISVNAEKTPVQYYPPAHGIRIVATTRNADDVGKKIEVIGKQRGFQVAPMHNGVKTAGEVLTIYAEDDPNKKYSAYTFDEISAVVKDITCDYVLLSGIDTAGKIWHLAHYHPDEEIPMYTEADLSRVLNFGECYLHVLGKVNPSIRYIRDEDILPINSLGILQLLAKRARYEASADFNEVNIQEQRLRNAIRSAVSYQEKATRQLSFALEASGASLSNV